MKRGLVKKQITDKNGKRTTVYVAANKNPKGKGRKGVKFGATMKEHKERESAAVKWENDVANELTKLGMSRGDAQGIMEANSFKLNQASARDVKPSQVAKMLTKQESSSKEAPNKKRKDVKSKKPSAKKGLSKDAFFKKLESERYNGSNETEMAISEVRFLAGQVGSSTDKRMVKDLISDLSEYKKGSFEYKETIQDIMSQMDKLKEKARDKFGEHDLLSYD